MADKRLTSTRHAFGREIISIGLDKDPLHDLYHTLLTMPWRSFFGVVLAGYLVVNSLFALGYLALGDAILNARPGSFLDCFFFSVQTLATIGYGQMAPRTLGANILMSLEALLGILGLAITTGLVFARFSRPTARVLFSRVAVVSRYDGVPSLMFRMANAREKQIVEARLRLALLRNERTLEGEPVRRLYDLKLRRSEQPLFALTWTAVHAIDEDSPLYGLTPSGLKESLSDLVVSLTGVDEGLAQTIYARYVYRAEDVRFAARFVDILRATEDRSTIDFTNFHEVVPSGEFEVHRAAEGAS
ncbi:MAG TPA: ion channel [Anaeromyxobacteraceae bacterium]|nr:ion channel [Anaeromyxobacteraceae bacterium]